MDIHEMHNMFRTVGQQMGMQKIRAILPESIDVFIHLAEVEKVRAVIATNANTTFRDRVAIQDNSISPINSVKSLYRKGKAVIDSKSEDDDFYVARLDNSNVLYYTSFAVKYDGVKRVAGARLIEGDKIPDTLSDYCSRASWDYPIVTLYADDNDNEYLELYTDSDIKIPSEVQFNYIRYPRKVKWNANQSNSVNSELPIGLHNEIIEIAVGKFFKSVGFTTPQSQGN